MTLARRGVGLALPATICAVGCSVLIDTSDLAGTDAPDASNVDGAAAGADGSASADATGDAGSDGAPDAGDDAAPCPSDKGPAMVRAGSFCIDATEVTVDQYQAFVAAKGGDTSGQPAACGWNTTFSLGCTPTSTASTAAVTCVDWCDAWAYCAWAGKHLCGKIGGGVATLNDATNPAADEWYAACSGGGVRSFPYGGSFTTGACNDMTRGNGKPIEVGILPTCEGGYPGIFDMSGNTAEWVDLCVASPDGGTGSTDSCYIRGGAWDDSAATFLGCANHNPQNRSSHDATKGFRCCK